VALVITNHSNQKELSMRNSLAALLLLAASVVTSNAAALDFSYQTDEMQNYGTGFTFPELNLDQAKANLVFTSNEHSDPKLSKVTIDFENARDITASNFTRSDSGYGDVYYAVVNKAWVFKQVIVEVTLNSGWPLDNVQIRVFVPYATSELGDAPVGQGVDLFQSGAPTVDVSKRRVADVGVFWQNQKRVLVKLKDRVGSQLGQPGVTDFELEVDWHGHGLKTIYIPAPNNYITAIGLVIEEHDYAGVVEHTVAIRYADRFGSVGVSESHPITQILEDAFQNSIF